MGKSAQIYDSNNGHNDEKRKPEVPFQWSRRAEVIEVGLSGFMMLENLLLIVVGLSGSVTAFFPLHAYAFNLSSCGNYFVMASSQEMHILCHSEFGVLT